MRGKMLWFNTAKNRGYITAEGGERVAVSGGAFQNGWSPSDRCQGTDVEFRVTGLTGALNAEDVAVVPEGTQRRARRRRRG